MAVARPGPRAASAVARQDAHRARLVVVDARVRPAAARDGDRAVREARALAASASGDDVALATTADGLVEGPTADLALIETALERLAPTGGDARRPGRGSAGADTVHFHDGRRAFPQPRSFRRRAFGVRGGGERRHHRVRRATRALRGHGRRPGVSGDRQLLATRAEGARLDHARHRGGVRSTRDACGGRSGSTGRAAHRGRRSAAAGQDQRPGGCAVDRRRGRGVDPGRRAAHRRRRERKGQCGSPAAQAGSVRSRDRDGAGYVSAGQGRRGRLRPMGSTRGADAALASGLPAAGLLDSALGAGRKEPRDGRPPQRIPC